MLVTEKRNSWDDNEPAEDMEDPLRAHRARLQASQQERVGGGIDGPETGTGMGRDGPHDYDLTTSQSLSDPEKRPLIEQVSNQWQSKKSDCGDLEDEGSLPKTTRQLLNSRRARRMLAFILLCAVGLYYIWTRLVQPRLAEEWAYKEGSVNQENGTYGIAKGESVDKEMVRIEYLSHDLLPGGPEDPKGKRRLVFVGDVHGCKKELKKLLDKVDFNEETDHLVLVGDTISKGPDNVGVLDELIRLNATSVRGNHEDSILHVAKKHHAHTDLEATGHSKSWRKDAALVKQLKPHHLEYLRAMPLMLHIPSLPLASVSTKRPTSPITEHILVVHAGLVPGVRLEKQDPYFVMNMRSINRRTHVPSALRNGKNAKPWYVIWCWYNDKIFKRSSFFGSSSSIPAEGDDEQQVGSGSWFNGLWKGFFGKKTHPRPQVVIYGHDSKTGLQINRWSKGLDSGCVKGGKLTALVLDAKGRQELKHVKCKNHLD